MKVEINTSSYNEKRYGKPYIARVDFSDPKGIPTWGDWVGQAGDAGLLTIDAYPGDIIMRGQKDNRNPKYSAPSYGQVNESGGIDWLDTKAEAYKAWIGESNETTARSTITTDKQNLCRLCAE